MTDPSGVVSQLSVASNSDPAKILVDADLNKIFADAIAELTSGAGVTIDGMLIKDGAIAGGLVPATLTATGAITLESGLVILAHNTVVIAATKAAPKVGDLLVVYDGSASGTAAHTVTLPSGVTWDGTNRIATLNAPGECIVALAVSTTRFLVLINIGSVAFS